MRTELGDRNEPNDGRDTQSGSVENSAEPRFLVVGRVLRPHGVRGEVRVEMHTAQPERFTWLEQVYLATHPDDVQPRPVPVTGARFHKKVVLLKLGGYEDRNAAETLRGRWLLVPEEDAIPLEEDEYYLYELEGLAVFSDEGERLGVLVEVLETKANNVFVVAGPRGEVLLPDIDEVVQEIDFETGRVVVHLLPGLL